MGHFIFYVTVAFILGGVAGYAVRHNQYVRKLADQAKEAEERTREAMADLSSKIHELIKK